MSAAVAGGAAIRRRLATMRSLKCHRTLWVALCILAGIAPGRIEVVQADIPISVLIWALAVPMPLRVDAVRIVTRAKGWYERA